MRYFTYILGVVLTRKDTYPKWSKNIKLTFIYNDLWEKICEGTETNIVVTIDPKPPTLNKEFFVW